MLYLSFCKLCDTSFRNLDFERCSGPLADEPEEEIIFAIIITIIIFILMTIIIFMILVKDHHLLIMMINLITWLFVDNPSHSSARHQIQRYPERRFHGMINIFKYNFYLGSLSL